MAILPYQIKQIIGNKKGTKDHIGESDSTVILYDDLVLKISKKTIDAKRESRALVLLDGYIPVPKVLAYVETKKYSYLLMSKSLGKPLFEWPVETAIQVACDGLKRLWAVRIEDELLSSKAAALNTIRYNVANHKELLIENADTETFTKEGTESPEALLYYLETHYPDDEPLVLSHGDYYLPNVLYDGNQITSMIDFGYIGYFPKERDISALLKSLVYNYGEHPNCLPWVEKALGYSVKTDIIEYFKLYDELI
jgi:kanamycin kinase/aminoglycoside 3'-phosphotransferase-3